MRLTSAEALVLMSKVMATLALTITAQFKEMSASDLLSRSILALGGANTLAGLHGISYHTYLYRTQTMEESKTPGFADVAVATAGSETVSYDLSNVSSSVIQRIDRTYNIGNFFNFARPGLEATNMSLVVRGGGDGYACYVKGNEHIFNTFDSTFGYTDPYLAGVFARDALRLSPTLLLQMQQNPHSLSLEEIMFRETGPFPAVYDRSLNLTVIFDPETYLPYIIRAPENHLIYGPSTNDFLVTNYTTVAGMKFPQNVELVYNQKNLIFQSLRDTITVNPSFPEDFFTGLPESQIHQTYSTLPPSAPEVSSKFGAAEVFENNWNMVWYFPFDDTLANLTVTQPEPRLPNIYLLTFAGSFYTCTVGVFEDAVLVTDAAPHQSKLVIQWVKQYLKRDVTHLLVTHHHHDHNYGAVDFVDAGAKLVVPEDFTYYWLNISGVQFETVAENKPFIHKDSKLQVRAVFHKGYVHADDWMYFMWTEACPNDESPVIATLADAWSPGFIGYEFDKLLATAYVEFAREDHMPYHYLVVPIHGTPHNITDLYEELGYVYPPYKTTDYLAGGPLC